MRIRMGLLLKWRMVYGVLAAPRRVVKMENTSVYIQKIHTTFSVLLHAGLPENRPREQSITPTMASS